MTPSSFYRPLQPDICQGDIFDDVPHVHLKPPIRAVREANVSKPERQIWGLYEWPPAPGQEPALPKASVKGGGFHFDPPKGEEVAASCQVARAIILNHDCDIENDKKHRLIAMIHPLSTMGSFTTPTAAGPKDIRDVVRENLNSTRFYLPPGTGMLEESYVDFRRLSCISPDFLQQPRRVASLSEDAFKSLLRQLFLLLTRLELQLLPPATEMGPEGNGAP